MFPAEGEVGLVVGAALAVAVLVVLDIVAAPVPTEVLLLALPLGVEDDLHPHPVEVVELVLVQNVELHRLPPARVRHLEEKPLRVAVGVYVVLQKKVVLVLTHAGSHRKVAALEPGFKHQGLVVLVLGSIVGVDRRFTVVLFGRFSSVDLVEVAGPNVPVLVAVVDSSVALLLVLPVDDVVKCFSDPAELVVFVNKQHVERLVERLKVGDDSHEIGQRKHREERPRFVADWLGEQHQGRRDEVLGDQHVEGLL